MFKRVKKVVAFALALTMLMGMGTMAFAAENESEPVCAEGLVESVSFTENAVSIESLNGRFAINQVTDGPALASVAGDQYEPNNSFATATSGLMGRKIAATLYEGDVDWYELNITDTSLDYAFILMNMQLENVPLTREALVKIERGIQHIQASQLRAIRNVLGTTYDELLK